MKPKLWRLSLLVLVSVCFSIAESKCSKGCDLALASYYFSETNLTFIAQVLQSNLNINPSTIVSYNKQTIANENSVQDGVKARVPFPCDCINGQFLGHMFEYTVHSGVSYMTVAQVYYANLTTYQLLQQYNSYDPNDTNTNTKLNVMVTCSCGSSSVSKDYGLFITYPLRPEDTIESIASATSLSAALLERISAKEVVWCISPPKFLGTMNFHLLDIFSPFFSFADQNDNYPPLVSSTSGLALSHSWFYRLAAGVIAGIAMGAVAIPLLLATCIYFGCYRKMKVEALLPFTASEGQHGRDPRPTMGRNAESTGPAGDPDKALGCIGMTVHKSVEFSYEELATATNDFSMASKIGEGGFGVVYYAELRGKKAAIKKMDMQASKEFLAELKVLTSVHHLNLVCLIGYCIQGSLFLVYEYVENGNLKQHLRGTSGRDPLTWPTRIQIALDSARGLEYIHEHTIPVYIHRDIKSANILIDENFHAKVADFGLAKLSEVGGVSSSTQVMGTFGYMPPEYAWGGDVSPKVDVYAFGVVLFELISAKEALLKAYDSTSQFQSLVSLLTLVLEMTTHLTQSGRWLSLPKHAHKRIHNYVQV
uniref:non-specific serine/threonine protein kinase n=1 Tax=Quercus lobata TaxID=97700 RepID=A0A7N2MB13_QUELO